MIYNKNRSEIVEQIAGGAYKNFDYYVLNLKTHYVARQDMRKEDEGEMAKVITYGGDTKIGAYKFADRKKVCLCIEKGNEITIYGTFNSEYCANNFMDELGKFLGAEFDCPTEKGGVE